ncbi:molybdenum cofactor guanylyltransferase MobA [Rubellimicrobium sp. CFH 75288]|uniref:molybdenum cofactor guanylyltransferase MobA n=1 Tax=Rubellimicrobium sp. CFH 75288 TaxID=2697034 RepID=UPI001412F1ED|nr:molybdenum cofactor guanylyltransferase MobA [Rubellimicrobium sp. CFH 75288]NAZ37248.1 molybdenum cofactor guanylyltransferase MobA [Rubellimicrobium sp. CFH 75288]
MPTPPPPAVILAGGLARRMGGGDKALLPWPHGGTLLDAILGRLRPQAEPVALNANGDPARFAPWGLPVLPDPVPGHAGPLAGVLAALRWAETLGAAHVLTVPCDTPFLPRDLVARLVALGAPAVAASGGRVHPVVALWPVAAAARLAAALAAGERRVGVMMDALGAGQAEFPVPSGGPDPFANLNRPEEWHAALARAG